MNAAELKVPPVGLVMAFVIGMWVVSAHGLSLTVPLPGHVTLAALLVAVGLAICVAGIVQFRRANTTVNPLTPETTTAMVTSGMYRFSRSPMYLSFLFALTGWAVFLSHSLALALLTAFVAYMNRFRILLEERALAAKFGHQFTDYSHSVRRWL